MRKTISIAELAQHTERIANDIDASGAIYCIKRRGKVGMMLMDADYYEGWRAAVELMKRPNWQSEWARALQERATGNGRTLDEVAKELGLDRPAQSNRRGTASRASATGRAKGARRASRSR